MIADYFFASIAILGALIGTATDLKNRWVPDWVNYFMISVGLGGHAIVSFLQTSPWPLIYSAVAAGIFLAAGVGLVYTGLWGGGDAKMLVGFGALLPTTSLVQTPWPFPLTVLLNAFIFGAVLGILGALYLAFKNKEAFLKEFKKELKENKLVLFASPAILILPVVSFYLGINLVGLIGILLFLFIPLVFVLKAVERACMFKFISPSTLVEGDWIAQNVNVGKYSYIPSRSGIELNDIKDLQKLEKLGKLKQVKVKEGLPYIPAFLVGLLVSLFFGDMMFIVIRAIFA